MYHRICCVWKPLRLSEVSVYTQNLAWMAIPCQSAGDNDDFHSAFITSGKH